MTSMGSVCDRWARARVRVHKRAAMHVQKLSHGSILSLQHKYGDGERGDIGRYKSSSVPPIRQQGDTNCTEQGRPRTQSDTYLIKG